MFTAASREKNFNSMRIRHAALSAVNFLDPKLEFWQQHKPFYTRSTITRKRFSLIPEREKTNWTIHNALLELVHIEMCKKCSCII